MKRKLVLYWITIVTGLCLSIWFKEFLVFAMATVLGGLFRKGLARELGLPMWVSTVARFAMLVLFFALVLVGWFILVDSGVVEYHLPVPSRRFGYGVLALFFMLQMWLDIFVVVRKGKGVTH